MKATWLYGAVIGALVILSGVMYMTETKETTTVIAVKDEEVKAKEAETEASPALMMVYVTGAVVTPDVYEVPKGSRLYEIIDTAGGFLPEASKEYLNLARVVFDGEQIHVPLEAAVEALSEGHDQGRGSKISLNKASKEQLMTLKGVGEARAEAIIDYRKHNGPFKRPEDIMKVRGIKEAMYEKIKKDITI